MNERRSRLWVEQLAPGALVLTGAQAHYVRDVLRLGAGARVALVGDGLAAEAVVRAVHAAGVELEVGAPAPIPRAALALTVGVPPPKGERADWLVEKLTELGVGRVVWLATGRSVVTPRQAGQRAARWQRLAEAAARQSGRGRTPVIEGPVELDALLQREAAARYVGARGAEPLVRAAGGRPATASAILLVGPEGGFTETELIRAQERGYVPVGLGPHVLRMETAAVAGAAVLLCDGDAPLTAPPMARET